MSRTLIVNNIPFVIPDAGEDPGWGEQTTDFLDEVSTVLGSLLSSGDILETTFDIANNVSSATDVVGLVFNTGVVRAANIQYSIYRISTGSPSGNAETGLLQIVYDDSATSGNKWLISQETSGNSGVTFSITDAGQFQYTSSDIGTPGYSGVMKFNAKTTNQ